MLTEKEKLRREGLYKRVNLSEEKRKKFSERIVNNLESLPEYKSAKKVLLYCPVKGEPDLTPLFEKVLKGKELILPKVKGKELELYKVSSYQCLKKGKFGIPEPIEGKIIPPEELDFIVIPGIVFDLQGYRLGFGKGYYDRLLKKTKGIKVGVAYSFQLVDKLPRDPWDVPVDIIVTEKNIRRLRNGLS
ncbi:MAG TPA: 5-formyltetrahydrofolate cyclo-ligase [Aquifex aeolicus]|nr:5-formyltetrahydrofolate cyclo-ligase [Aquifex aeolicus]